MKSDSMHSTSTSLDSNSEAKIVDSAITSRRSVRQFLPDPVPRKVLEDILAVASRAPSGTNMQPWKVHVLGGQAKQKLSEAIVYAHDHHAKEHQNEYRYYPPEFPEPYKSRRRKIGWDLYGLLEIERGETEKMHAQHARNYEFFDAPVGLIFTIDRVLEKGSWLDFGMFLQNIMTAARGRGLDTCPQAAFAQYHRIIREQLGLAESEVVVCGMAIGHADNNVPVNTLVTERVPVSEFAKFIDYD
jgi:nitroreductase